MNLQGMGSRNSSARESFKARLRARGTGGSTVCMVAFLNGMNRALGAIGYNVMVSSTSKRDRQCHSPRLYSKPSREAFRPASAHKTQPLFPALTRHSTRTQSPEV
jgi:hypothetical protein